MENAPAAETIAEVGRELRQAFQRLKTHDYTGAERLVRAELDRVRDDPAAAAVCYSVLGIVEKLKGDPKAAWRHYQQAERLTPEDPALKIIVAKFLLETFAQYDTAVKKLKAVLKLARGVPSFEHQAHALLAVAALKQGQRKKAVEFLDKAMAGDFAGLASAESINLELVEAFLHRNFEVERCRAYLEKALRLAESRREERPTLVFRKLLEATTPVVS